MSLRLLTIVHQDDTGPGVFNDAIYAAAAEQHVWMPALDPTPPAAPTDYDAVLTFGGSAHPVQDAEHRWLAVEREFLAQALDAGVPMLGVCLGSQLIAQAAGAAAYRVAAAEIGWYPVSLLAQAGDDPLFAPLAGALPEGSAPGSLASLEVLHWHSYAVELPPGATALAGNDTCLQAYRVGDRVWGIQFHAEVTEADFQGWIELDGGCADAVQIGFDAAAVTVQTHERIDGWNQLGRELCARFLRVVSAL